jgi:hypothetical protein
MANNPKISLIIHTASADNMLQKEHNIDSMFQMYIDCLEQQTFKDFEFILVDGKYDENKESFKNIKTSFVVKHVPIHDNHRYWFDKNLVHISSIKNTGLLYADGELCISVDDAELFHDKLLDMYWYYYQSGFLMNSLFKRFKTISVNALKRVNMPILGEEYNNDPRFNYLKNENLIHSHGDLLYAGTSFTLNSAIKLNGFNEKMDGCKSLEDVEFGIRLQLLGHKFVMDRRGFVYIIDHSAEYSNKIENIITKENYGFIQMLYAGSSIIANKVNLTKNELDIINQATIKYRKKEINYNSEDTTYWLNTPNFNLEKEREELRSSSDWRW